MSDNLNREVLCNALYDSLSEIPMWESFLQRARSIFQCDHVSLILAPSLAPHNAPVCVTDDDMMAEPLDRFWQSGFCADLRDGKVAPYAMPEDGWRMLILPVSGNQALTAHLALWRKYDAAPFSDEDEALLNSLAQPLEQGMRVYERIVELERRQMLSNAAIETSGIGVILADSDGKILLTNPIADALLAAGDGLHRAHGKLKASSAAETTRLISEIRQRASEQSAHSNWDRYSPIAIKRDGQVLPLTVIVRPGPPFYPLKRPLHRTAILVLRDPNRQPMIPATTLASLFGLTPAEATLASALGRGASLEEAAAAIGVSRHTVRSQLQGIFLKTGTNRQGELVRILLSSAAVSS
ncbi:hypothetical protein [Sphingomonas sp. C3-2]|uniref:helix-turn-helix transcriptional regulator n=1 Tax=Sphingomonas sp. C3-2 TaxID=3062169 RepID=UPI00294B10C0|nr:hypothetical protein [Sphingomonas sp. C3-2]WOK35492.1 hypothetical protein QYC26_10755 [Sphingomonas sp. C3-2]